MPPITLKITTSPDTRKYPPGTTRVRNAAVGRYQTTLPSRSVAFARPSAALRIVNGCVTVPPARGVTVIIGEKGIAHTVIHARAIVISGQVVGNLTAVGFNSAGGYLAIHPGVSGTYVFDADPSSLNFGGGEPGAIANSFVCGLDSSGRLTVSIRTYSGTTNFIIDITGYIQ